MGRVEEALAEITKARDLDPLSPRLDQNVGLFYYLARDYERALREFDRSLDFDPVATHADRGTVHVQRGAYQEAIADADRAGALEPEGPHLPLRAYIYASAGQRDKAAIILGRLESLAGTSYRPADVGLAWAAFGDLDRAFVWLERAYSQRALVATALVASPAFDSFRGDPRFADLLRRMNLPPRAIAYATKQRPERGRTSSEVSPELVPTYPGRSPSSALRLSATTLLPRHLISADLTRPRTDGHRSRMSTLGLAASAGVTP